MDGNGFNESYATTRFYLNINVIAAANPRDRIAVLTL
jgi:hypothetical protein